MAMLYTPSWRQSLNNVLKHVSATTARATAQDSVEARSRGGVVGWCRVRVVSSNGIIQASPDETGVIQDKASPTGGDCEMTRGHSRPQHAF
eukprot:6214205-Pleurochrysis_carterae.AAC.1